MLPDRSILIGQNLVENAKNSNETFWVIFKQCAYILILFLFETLQIFEFWHFPPIFVLFKLTCLVTLFSKNRQIGYFWHF